MQGPRHDYIEIMTPNPAIRNLIREDKNPSDYIPLCKSASRKKFATADIQPGAADPLTSRKQISLEVAMQRLQQPGCTLQSKTDQTV